MVACVYFVLSLCSVSLTLLVPAYVPVLNAAWSQVRPAGGQKVTGEAPGMRTLMSHQRRAVRSFPGSSVSLGGSDFLTSYLKLLMNCTAWDGYLEILGPCKEHSERAPCY